MLHDQSTISDKTSLFLFIVSFVIANLNAATEGLKFIAALFAACLAVVKFVEWVQTQSNKRKNAKRKGGI